MGRPATLGALNYIGKRRIDLPVEPDDRPVLERHMAVLAARQPFQNMLYRVSNEDGSTAWIRASGKPVFDIAGQFMGYRGSASDVTDDMAKREQLSRQRLFMERAEEVAKLGHWSWNAITGESVWSESVYDILDFAPGERTPDLRRLAAKVHPDDRASFVAAMKDLELGRTIMDREYRHVRPSDGELRYFQLRVDLEHTPVGEFIGTFGIIQDVTDRKLSELQLQQRTEQLTEAQKLGRTGDWSWRIGDETLWWSPQIFHLLGLDPASFYPTRRAVLKLYVGDGVDRVLQSQAIVARELDVRSVDVKIRRGDGSTGDFAVTSKAILDRNGKLEGFSGTIQDITERKQAEEQLEQLAYYDPLTGLANRALFRRQIDDVLERTHRSGVSAALLLLDLDRFKEVNDSLGHAAGDELLAKVAHLLGRVIGRVIGREVGGGVLSMSDARGDASELADKNKARVAGCDACLAWSNGIGQAAIT
jgi:PAS domain-containing protein